jgi:hypothetical protein
VKYPQNIAIFASYGLWSYNFVRDVKDPIETRRHCTNFRRLFYQVKFILFSLKNMMEERVQYKRQSLTTNNL